MLPDFLCIGAQKSGTTTIWHILNAHKDICMAWPRETRFFCDNHLYNEGVVKYETKFFAGRKSAKRVGEKCPEYLFVPDTAKKIFDALGEKTQFIISLRSPAQRAFSHYRHNMAMMRECRPFTEVLENEAKQLKQGEVIEPPFGYISRGMYSVQIKRYLQRFDKKNILFISFENEILKDQASLAIKLYGFLGVDQVLPNGLPFKSGHPKLEMLSMNFHSESNTVVVSQKKEVSGWRKLFHPNQNVDEIIHNPSKQLIDYTTAFNKNKPEQYTLSKEEEISFNRQYFKEDIEKLKAIVDWDISNWLQ
ncbi:MAG: sulfotransferase domain-containing protein [Bacteroidetes bacterium]|nr:sulfotransferase domain-containing protein [Bacteroidota bacterium]